MIEKHILRLLEKNNRVIIPDFGAFLKGSGSSKNIFFNEFIKVDDGLLINSIIENEKLSRNDVSQEIAEFIEKVNTELSNKQKSVIEGFGVLFKDEKDIIKFEIDEKVIIPVNPEKKLKTVEKEKVTPVKKIDKKQTKMENPTPTKKETKTEKKKNKTLILILFIVILIIILAVLGYLYQDDIFGNKVKKEADKIELIKKAEKENQVASLAKEKAKELVVQKAKEETKLAEIEAKKELALKNQKFYLIGGVFKEIQNAKDLLSELEYEGFNEAKFIEIDGLNYLCYNSYKSYSKAKAELQNAKDKGYEVWILKH